MSWIPRNYAANEDWLDRCIERLHPPSPRVYDCETRPRLLQKLPIRLSLPP